MSGVLNGSKCFITNGKEADVYIIIAVTGTIEKRGREGKRDLRLYCGEGNSRIHLRNQGKEDGYPRILYL